MILYIYCTVQLVFHRNRYNTATHINSIILVLIVRYSIIDGSVTPVNNGIAILKFFRNSQGHHKQWTFETTLIIWPLS